MQSARADSAADALELVRPTYIDGFPTERARALDAAGVARLAALLRQTTELAAHCNAVTALGWSGRADAVAALIEYAASAPRGDLPRARYCALTRVPLALGHLARTQDAAFAWLLEQAAQGARDPGWSHGHQSGQRLALLLDEQVLTGLALSGRPEAEPWLRDATASAARQRSAQTDVLALRRQRHVAALRELRARIEAEGESAP